MAMKNIPLIVLLGLLLVPFAGVAQTSEQSQAIAASDVFAAGAPHGDWNRIGEPVPFYLTGNTGQTGATWTSTSLTYVRPAEAVNGPLGASNAALTFTLPAGQAVTAQVTVASIRVVVHATCVQDIVNPVEPSITFTLGGTRTSAGANPSSVSQNVEASGDLPNTNNPTVRTFQHEFVFGQIEANTGRILRAGDAISLGLSANVPCQLQTGQTGSNPSRVIVNANTALINMWPADLTGEPIRSLPHASKVVAAQRNFDVHAAYVSLWPCLNQDDHNGDGTSECGTHPGRDVMDDFWTASGGGCAACGAYTLQMRRLSDNTVIVPANPGQTGTTGLVRSSVDTRTFHEDLAPSVQAQSVGLTYNDAITEDTYRLELRSTGGGIAQSRVISVGGKGFELSSIDGQIHDVNPREPTTFRVRATNVGGERDVISFSITTSGAGWDVRLINGQVTIEPNGQAEAIIRATPPASAIAGESLTITVTAVSSFPQEVPSQTMPLVVNLVSPVTTGAQILGGPGSLDIFPGANIDIAGLRLHNTGSSVGTYVISTSFSPAASSWLATPQPPSRTVDAKSIDDFTLRLSVPANAVAGEQRNLRISATLLGESTPKHTMTIPITVVFTPDLDIVVRAAAQSLRGDASTAAGLGGSSPAFNDRDHDRDAIYRLEVTNPTAVEQSYRVTNSWLRNTYLNSQGNHLCVNPPSHRGWQIALLDPSADAPAFTVADRNLNAEVVIPGSTTLDLFVKLNWVPGTTNCPRDTDQTATLRFQSLQDQDFRLTQALSVNIVAPPASGVNGINTGTHNPSAEMGRAEGIDTLVDPNGIAVREGSAYTAATYDFVVLNDGSEFDSYVVEIPPASRTGWSHSIAFVGADTVQGTYRDHPNRSPSRGAVSCTETTVGRVLRCSDIGVGDQLAFRLTVTPPPNEPLGRFMDTSLIVTSIDSLNEQDPGEQHFANKDNLNFRTQTVGVFDHASSALRVATDVEKGRTGALPFVVENVGTNADTYTISLTGGDATWKPRFSSSLGGGQEVSVPGRSDYAGFLLVEAPTTATTTKSFTISVESQATGKKTGFTLDARPVNPPTGAFAVSGDPTNSFVLPARGVPNDVAVKLTGGTGGQVSFRADIDSLPEGWRIEEPTTVQSPIVNSAATAVFKVVPPNDALGTSQVALRVVATSGTQVSRVDLILTLESEAAIDIRAVGSAQRFVAPGSPTTWELDIINLGLGQDTVTLAATQLPPGWSVNFEATQLSIGPLASQTTSVDVFVPTNADPRANVTFSVVAASTSNPGVTKQVALNAIVGFRELQLLPVEARVAGAPEETLSFAVTLSNNGTLSDRVQLSAQIVTPGYADKATATVLPGSVDLLAGQRRDLLVNVELGRDVPAEVGIVVRLTATSLFAPSTLPVSTNRDLTAEVLPHVTADVDGDLVMEFAVDRNEDQADGYEEFRDSIAPGGRSSVSADLQRFLASGRTMSPIDGDEDGKRDHFIDHTGDGLPDAYWDPDDRHTMPLTIVKDVDADSVADYFVDTDGNGVADRLYNVRTGEWIGLIARDVDGDGTQDLVVDINGNGQVDRDETILFSRGGILVKVLKVDVDGDGRLDEVFDINGDDRPDHFVRDGEQEGRDIVLKDVNGDGILDWTYDSNLDGRPDRYYDPASGTGGHVIDQEGSFKDLVTKYWFVPALFLLVLVLFAVLVAVTRR